MRLVVVLAALAGCNSVYDLRETAPLPPIDAQYFDAPPDAPFACPPTGETPQFSRVLNQVIQNCAELSTSTTGRAVAYCREPVVQIAEGPTDEALVPIPELVEVPPLHVDLVRYAPEGDELWVRIWHQNTVVGRIAIYRREGTTVVHSHDVTSPSGTFDSFVRFGAPSAGPVRRVMIRNGSQAMQEIEVDSTGASTVIDTYEATDLGVATLGIPGNISPDGLRYVFNAGTSTYYADRASISERFSPGRELVNVPINPAPFMTADCGRLYFTAVGYVFWVQRT